MQPGFSFITFVNRWRNLAAKAKWNIKEEDAVQMVIDNLHGPIKEAMVLGDCRTFPQLFERAARMQRSIKDGSITFRRNCSNGGEGKPKNTLRTQQPTQEVTITPNPIYAVQAQQNAQRQQSTRNQQAIQGAGAVPQPTQQPQNPPTQSQPQNPAQAPPRPAYNKAAPPANYDPQQQQGAPKRPWGPNRAHYPPLPLPIPTLFSILLTGKPFLCQNLLLVSTMKSSVHFTDTQAIPSKSVILCVMSSMT